MNKFRLEQMVNNNFIYLPKYPKDYKTFNSLKYLIEYYCKVQNDKLEVFLWNHNYSENIRELMVKYSGERIIYYMKDVQNLDNVPSELHKFIKDYSKTYINKMNRIYMIDNILNNG